MWLYLTFTAKFTANAKCVYSIAASTFTIIRSNRSYPFHDCLRVRINCSRIGQLESFRVYAYRSAFTCYCLTWSVVLCCERRARDCLVSMRSLRVFWKVWVAS